MTTKSELLRLAERVEKATAAEQWALIRQAADLLVTCPKRRAVISRYLAAEAYESAAMMLVPEGAEWAMWSDGVCNVAFSEARAATPALALTAACLRARADTIEEE